MKLDKRMSAILAEIPKGKNLADIGADHGYISINYAINNPNNLVVASDISKKSIEKAYLSAKKLHLDNYITTVGDGLLPIQHYDIDVILISGMGGEEIIKIINNEKKYPFYILSPQKNTDKVRQCLSENNICPIKDYKVLSDGKFYDIMVCKQGEYNPSEYELLFGCGSGEDFCEYKKFMNKNLSDLTKKVSDNEKVVLINKLNLLNSK